MCKKVSVLSRVFKRPLTVLNMMSVKYRVGHISPYIMLLGIICVGLVITPTIGDAQGNGRLFVFAASSLTDAFLSIEASFEAQYPDTDVILNFAGSSTLATQILQGAPADVFASANDVQMSRVEAEGLLTSRARPFARNRLVLITPLDNPAQIHSLPDLTNERIQLVVASQGVPARTYTEDVLQNLSEIFGRSYASDVLANVVSEEDNVRRVVLKITLGEADVGFVYVSDVTPDIASQVNMIEIPADYNRMATYPIAPLVDGDNRDDARLFIDYVLSRDGQNIIASHGLMSSIILKTPLYFGN